MNKKERNSQTDRKRKERKRGKLCGIKWKDNIDLKKETLLHTLICMSHLTIFVFCFFFDTCDLEMK